MRAGDPTNRFALSFLLLEEADVHPERIGKFEIIDELGHGGMGVVYRARDTRLRRDVALKVIRPEQTLRRSSRSRFIQECRAAAALNHPGIATLYEADETDDGQLYFAGELVPGETLASRLGRLRPPVDEIIDFGLQLSEALAAAHEHGIIHRDIKPGNLMVTPEGRVKILDFGLARLMNPEEEEPAGEHEQTRSLTRSRSGVPVGTPVYMAPEQASGGRVDARADIFATGAVLYEMATGHSAFGGDSIEEIFRKILAEEPRAPEEIDPTLPAGLIDAIRRCLAKPVDERFASATDLAGALRIVREKRASGSAETAAQVARRRRVRRLAPWVIAALVVAVVAFVAIRLSTRPTLAFVSRDHIMIADVDNQTGDEVFDTALRTALEYDLQQSPYAIVLDRNRLSRTLELMRRDPASRIDEELGREICLFTGVKALLLPRILAAGEAYDLQAILIEPESGSHVDRIRVTARGKEDVLLSAVDELTSAVRSRLGESLASIEDTDQQISDVTTASWEALRSLTLAHQHWRRSEYLEAADLFEDALEQDPDFVTARGSLGLLYLQFMNRPDEGKLLLREALERAGSASKRERLMLQAVNHEFVEGDLDRTLADYDLILDLYPDSAAALNNRGKVLEKLGRFDEAVTEFEKMLEVDPGARMALNSIWWNHMYYRRQPGDAEAAARRDTSAAPDDPGAWFRLGWSLVGQRRFAEAEAPLRRAVEIDPAHPYALPNLAHVLMATGSPEKAIPVYRQVRELTLQNRLAISLPEVDSHLALALRETGEDEEADRLLTNDLEQQRGLEGRPVWRLIHIAYLEASLGNEEAAEALIREVVEAERRGETLEIVDVYGLAVARAMMGHSDEALEWLARSFRDGYRWIYYPLVDPRLASLQGDPGFERVIRAREPSRRRK